MEEIIGVKGKKRDLWDVSISRVLRDTRQRKTRCNAFEIWDTLINCCLNCKMEVGNGKRIYRVVYGVILFWKDDGLPGGCTGASEKGNEG
jgi:hypothetical protein